MIERFIEYISSERRYSELTVRNYRRDIENFTSWFCQQRGLEAFDVTAVTAQDVSDWMIFQMQRYKKDSNK